MRQIKFRAWDGKNILGSINYGLVMDFEGKVFTHRNDNLEEVEFITLMQFTGLLDKNSKEIYEGDILKIVEKNDNEESCDHGFDIDVGTLISVKWMDGGFRLIEPKYWNNEEKGFCEICAACNEGGYLYSANHEIDIGFFAEVIGNIYENPELLK